MKVLLTLVFILIASASFSQDLGKNFPADYPADMPKPKITNAYPSSKQETSTVFNFDTDLKVRDAMKFFVEEMSKAGYTAVDTEPLYTDGDAAATADWKKGNTEVMIMIIKVEDAMSSISISYK